jgi:hypothetical protein
MMKSIKGKVVTGVVAVGLLSGVGAAFASTDAGAQLQGWYNKQFVKSSAAITAGAVKHVGDQADGLKTEYNNLRSSVTTDINDERDGQVTAKTTSINGTKDVYVNQVKDKEAAISAGMQSQFDAIFTYAQGVIKSTGNQALAYANKDLTDLSGKNGSDALEAVNTQLSQVQAAAKSDLEATIANAKTDLTNQLAADTTATTDDINAAIDAKIKELRGLIDQKAADLVAAQQKLIQDKAAELQAAAEADLDGVVQNINK